MEPSQDDGHSSAVLCNTGQEESKMLPHLCLMYITVDMTTFTAISHTSMLS